MNAAYNLYTTDNDMDNIVKFPSTNIRLPSDPVERYDRHDAEPIKSEEDINRMVSWCLERKKIRDAVLLVLGFNLGLRISDLLTIRYKDIFEDKGKLRDYIVITEQKTKNTKSMSVPRVLYLNEAARKAAMLMFNTKKKEDPSFSLDEYIFVGEAPHKAYVGGFRKSLNKSNAYRMIKSVGRANGVMSRLSTHTMRKTFGYFVTEKLPDQMKKNGSSALILQKIFHHSNMSTTMRYIGVDESDERSAYMVLNLGLDPIKKYEEGEVDH